MTRETVLSGGNGPSRVRARSGVAGAVAGGYNQPQATSRRRSSSWRDVRQGLGLSLREVEERTGINRGEVSRIERGFGPRPEHAVALFRLYGLAE